MSRHGMLARVFVIVVVDRFSPVRWSFPFHQRYQASSLNIIRNICTSQVHQSRSKVNILNQVAVFASGCDAVGPPDHQWYMERLFIHPSFVDRKSTRLNSSHVASTYADVCWTKR